MPQDDSLVNRLKSSSRLVSEYGCFRDSIGIGTTDLAKLLLEAASAIQTLKCKLGPQARPEGSTRGLMAT